jgi:hypothetical protein
MASDTTADVSNRLSITVPDYDTRLNLGTPDPGGGQPFGYTGFSAHSQYNFFVDIGRVGLYQTNLGSCWQVGGKWLQWSNQDMYLGTTGNNTFSADNKVTIVAGAGQGQITALTAAASQFESPRLVEYNNLQLHWRVDGVQVALKQFFYGYGQTSKINHFIRKDIPKSGVGDKGWRPKGAALQSAQDDYSRPDAGKSYPTGGFLSDVEKLLTDIGQRSLKPGLLRGFEWDANRMDMGRITGRASSYFSVFEPFDPYPPSSYDDKLPFAGTVAGMMQFINNMHRLVDVAKRILGALTTDNPIGKRALAFIQAWQDAQDVVTSIQNLCNDPLQWSRRTGNISQVGHSGGEWAVAAGHMPWNAQSEGRVSATAATTTSTDGPWTVAAGSTLTVTDGSSTLTITFTAAGTISATQLAAAINGGSGPWTLGGQVGHWTATTSGNAVTITNSRTGKSSQILVAGSNKDQMFDPNQQEVWGQDAGDSFQSWWDDERSIQISFSSLPEDLRDQVRPLYQAVGDFCMTLERGMDVFMDLVNTFYTGVINPPSMLGLIGKDGIALGTNGPLYGAGGGVTFVATRGVRDADNPDGNPAESDDDKYIPLGESVINWALDGDDPKKALQQKFQLDSSVKKAMRGHFRVAAERDVVLSAQARIVTVSLSETAFIGKKRTQVTSNEQVSVRSYTKSVELLGAEVRIGATKDSGKQKATTRVNVAASDRIDLRTEKFRLFIADDLLFAGKNDPDKTWFVNKNPHVFIDSADSGGSVMAGYWGGVDFFGLDVDAGGVSALTGKSVSLGVKSGAGIDVGKTKNTVTIYGDLKIGSTLHAKDTTSFTPHGVAFTPPDTIVQMIETVALRTPTDKADLTSKYASNKASANDEQSEMGLPSATNADKLSHAATLRTLYWEHNEILDTARSKELVPEDINWDLTDEDLFADRAPDDASVGSS